MADAWEWRAIYDSGEEVREADARTFSRVDRERCVAIELTRSYGLLGLGCQRKRVDVNLAKGERAVFFRRRTVSANLAGGPTVPRGTVTVAGWESPEGASYLVLGDEGSVRRVGSLGEV